MQAADGVGKHILKKAAEPAIDRDLIYRRKRWASAHRWKSGSARGTSVERSQGRV